MGSPIQSRPTPAHEQAGAVARHVVRVTADHSGRGPTTARATFGPDSVTVFLTDTLTRGERRLVDAGQVASVLEVRRGLQVTMRGDLVEGIEQITGRRVKACFSDHRIDPDIAVEVFLFSAAEPAPRRPRPDVPPPGPGSPTS